MLKCSVVIFSKDRPAQLDLLLTSLERWVDGWDAFQTTVLWKATTQAFMNGYRRVRAYHNVNFSFVEETNFREDVIHMVIAQNALTMFLVDDDVLLRPFSLSMPQCYAVIHDRDLACLSLRLNPTVTYSYVQDKVLLPPIFLPGLRFSWRSLCGDWGYPMSLDGHLFRTSDILPLIQAIEFTGPNAFESNLAKIPIDSSKMICFHESRIVNIPANRVQDYPSRNMGLSAGSINARFLDGWRIDLDSAISQINGLSVHQEADYQFIRDTRLAGLGLSDISLMTPSSSALEVPETLLARLERGQRRLHLGCGSRYLPDYVNVDIPPEGNVQNRATAPDVLCDLLTLDAPDGNVEEVYSAHVFEHFQRHIALGLLCRWNRWLCPDGVLRLEMPDVEACMKEFIQASAPRRSQLIRHMWGSHEAGWATHHEGWTPDTAIAALSACGFLITSCKTWHGRWPSMEIEGRKRNPPNLASILKYLEPMNADDTNLQNHWMGRIRSECGS